MPDPDLGTMIVRTCCTVPVPHVTEQDTDVVHDETMQSIAVVFWVVIGFELVELGD